MHFYSTFKMLYFIHLHNVFSTLVNDYKSVILFSFLFNHEFCNASSAVHNSDFKSKFVIVWLISEQVGLFLAYKSDLKMHVENEWGVKKSSRPKAAEKVHCVWPSDHLRRPSGVRQEIKQTICSFLFLAIVPVGKVQQPWKSKKVCSYSWQE